MLITSRVFWGVLVAVVLFSLFFILYRKFFFEKGHTVHKVMLALYALYIGGLFVLILFPNYMLRPFRFSTARVNLIPFKAFHRLMTDPKELIGNLLLFVPFGFFSVLNDRVKAGRRLLNVLWRTALISATMEVLQMFIGRVTDIDDVIINTLSGLLGGALCVIWHKTRLDHTPLGDKLMPELPKRWRGKMAVPLLSLIMLVTYGIGLMSANAIVTRSMGKEYSAEINGETRHFSLNAENALLWDRTGEKVLFAANEQSSIFPASTIKLVLGLTTLEEVSPDATVTVGREILRVPMDCSRAGIAMGSTYTVRELLAGSLIASGADASYVLGVFCGRAQLGNPNASETEALNAFLAAANAKLQSLGALHTTVKNVDGLDDDGQMTTVEDLCRIASAVLADPVLSEICSAPEMTIGTGNTALTLKNTNVILREESEFFDADCVGIKTGATSRAGNCLIAAFRKNGQEYITIVMRSGYDSKFTDTLTLADLVL